jgi:hypothetical protein
LKSLLRSHPAMFLLSGYSLCLATPVSFENFPRLASPSAFTQASTTLRTLCAFFPAGRPIHPLNLRFVCASPASPAAETAFNGLLPSPPWRSPCGFRCGSLLIAPLRKPVWRGCIKSGDNQSFNQQKPGVLSHSCERSLARGDFLRKLSGTYEPSDLRPFCYNIQKNTQHLLVARIARIAPPLLNPDPSVARTLRPDRFSLQFN